VAEGGQIIMSEARFTPSDSPRLAIPLAIIAVIDTLVADLGSLPDYRRAELRRIQSALRSIYKIPKPKLNEVELEHDLQELDGIPIEDAP